MPRPAPPRACRGRFRAAAVMGVLPALRTRTRFRRWRRGRKGLCLWASASRKQSLSGGKFGIEAEGILSALSPIALKLLDKMGILWRAGDEETENYTYAITLQNDI